MACLAGMRRVQSAECGPRERRGRPSSQTGGRARRGALSIEFILKTQNDIKKVFFLDVYESL